MYKSIPSSYKFSLFSLTNDWVSEWVRESPIDAFVVKIYAHKVICVNKSIWK